LPNFNKILEDLKNRKVFRSVTIYAAFAFMLLQVINIVFPALHLPPWTETFVVVLVIIGFPITLILSWIYDISPFSGAEKQVVRSDDVEKEPHDVPGEDVISQPTGKVSPSAKNIILISTLLGIIFYTNIFPLLQDIMNVDPATRNASMVPEQRLYIKYEHPDDVSENIRLIKNYLYKGDEDNNLEALNLTVELIIDDSTKADYYAYRGWVYFQRYDLNQEKPKNLLLESEKDFIRAIDLKHNLNKDAAVITYLHLASIYLIEDNIGDAYSMIKRAMRIDKKYPDVKKKLKEINKRKIQGLERSS